MGESKSISYTVSSNGTLICCHCFDADAADAGSGVAAVVAVVKTDDRATPAVVDADLVTKERRSSSLLLLLLLLDEENNVVLCERGVPRLLVGVKAATLLLTAARASMADE